MAVVRGFSSPVGHGENDARPDGSSELDGLLDLLVSCSELLRTCEVGYRSRFAMQSEDQSQVHQLLCLGVEHACGVGLLEVIGVALVRVEVAASKVRHFVPQLVDLSGTCISVTSVRKHRKRITPLIAD